MVRYFWQCIHRLHVIALAAQTSYKIIPLWKHECQTLLIVLSIYTEKTTLMQRRQNPSNKKPKMSWMKQSILDCKRRERCLQGYTREHSDKQGLSTFMWTNRMANKARNRIVITVFMLGKCS